MSDSNFIIAPVPTPDAIAAQLAYRTREIDNAAFQAEVAQQVENNDIQNLENNVSAPAAESSSDFFSNEGLLHPNTPTLSLFNEIAASGSGGTRTGNLTAQQLQNIGILQEDLLRLQEASISVPTAPLTDNATTVNLSAQAQNIASGISTATTAHLADAAPVPAVISASALSTLTLSQLQQVATIVTPFVNAPLTPALIAQLQTQLNAADISPLQLNMQTLYLVMNYIGGLQAAPMDMVRTIKSSADNKVATVAPIGSIDRTSVEDNALSD